MSPKPHSAESPSPSSMMCVFMPLGSYAMVQDCKTLEDLKTPQDLKIQGFKTPQGFKALQGPRPSRLEDHSRFQVSSRLRHPSRRSSLTSPTSSHHLPGYWR